MFATLATSFTRGPSYMQAPAPHEPDIFRQHRVIAAVVDLLGIPRSELLGANQTKSHVRGRWALMYVLRSLGWSSPQIGRALGNRDHTTVLYGVNRAEALLATDREFAGLVRRIEAVL